MFVQTFSVAVVISADLICAGVQLGWSCLSSAAEPATCGVAMLVPETCAEAGERAREVADAVAAREHVDAGSDDVRLEQLVRGRPARAEARHHVACVGLLRAAPESNFACAVAGLAFAKSSVFSPSRAAA